MPLILASGAGAEDREVIGVVVFSGVLFATLLTLFVVPVLYCGFKEIQLWLANRRPGGER